MQTMLNLPWSKISGLGQNADDPQPTNNFSKQGLSRTEQRCVSRTAIKVLNTTDTPFDMLRAESLRPLFAVAVSRKPTAVLTGTVLTTKSQP